MNNLEIGRLLRGGMDGFVAGCRVSQLESPSFGALVRVVLEREYQIYGLIYDIHVDDDGLVRQLVTTEGIEETVIADNRQNRNIPIEMSVLTIGFLENDHISHLLPPRPALSLDKIYLCNNQEIRHFTAAGSFGYFRHIFRSGDLPESELMAAHIQQADQAHREAGNEKWFGNATQELIIILRDDYPLLTRVLSALSDVRR